VPDLRDYKAIFFDAGGTLLHPYPSVGQIYSEVAARYGDAVNPDAIQRGFHQAWLERDGLSGLASHASEKVERAWWHQLVREVFEKAGWKGDFEPFFTELYDIFARPEVWRLYPGTLEVLATLKKRGHILGVVSNWDRRLFPLCEGLGLENYFQFIIASAVFGAAKPSARIFQEALRRAGVAPQEAIHVGDSLEDDVRGAQGAGLDAILINRHPERQALQVEQLRGVCVIHDLNELVSGG